MSELDEVKKTDWYKTRPELIRNLICRFPPTCSVRLKTTGQFAYVDGWTEDNTLRVIIDPEAKENENIKGPINVIYQVFGISPSNLEFLSENPVSVSLFLQKKMQQAAHKAVICGECSQPIISGHTCTKCRIVHGRERDACAYHFGYCCQCLLTIELCPTCERPKLDFCTCEDNVGYKLI